MVWSGSGSGSGSGLVALDYENIKIMVGVGVGVGVGSGVFGSVLGERMMGARLAWILERRVDRSVAICFFKPFMFFSSPPLLSVFLPVPQKVPNLFF